jgi:hypothetical protein
MIPDCTRRLNKAIEQLSNAIDSIKDDPSNVIYTNACEQLAIAKNSQ